MNADPGDDGRGARRLFVALAVVALVLGIAAWALLRPMKRDAAAPAGSPDRSLTLVAPRGEVEIAPTRFEWRPAEGARRYTVKIEDADAVWPLFVRSTDSPTLSLAPHEASALLPGRVHVWEVQAFDEAGRVIASGGTRFRVRAAVPPS